MNPVESGRTLEDIVQLATLKLLNVKSYREYDIRTHFEDPSLNGVDHWLHYEKKHILIQDKWRETTSQPEVGQFLQCADRISSRLPKEDKIFLIWCSKKEPTSFSLAMLLEKNVNIVVCGTSIENLARLCILQICDCFHLDPIPSLVEIRGFSSIKSMDRSNIFIDLYDDTEDKKSINNTIDKIHNIFTKIYESILSEELKSFIESFLPKDNQFTNYGKVDFNFFLKSLKPMCIPTKTKRFSSDNYFFYVKMRKVSIPLTILVNEYEMKRKTLSKKSAWAKTLCSMKCNPEPISETEFCSSLELCEDYYITVTEINEIDDTVRHINMNGSKEYRQIKNPKFDNCFNGLNV